MKSSVLSDKWNFSRLDLSIPRVMGILNITPDSFYDGGKYSHPGHIMARAETMLAEGASILDLGAVSTRPGAAEVNEQEEWERMKVVLPDLRKRFPAALLSVDTWRSSVARESLDAGADMINDISGGQFDPDMFALMAKAKVPYIIMHTSGKPKTMQQNPVYHDVVAVVDGYMRDKIEMLAQMGLTKNLILDPGFGFGKSLDHNYQLLHGLKTLKRHGFPLMAGLSRKSMINKVLDTNPENALNGTTALNMLALINHADILRVHDVKAATEAVKLYARYAENANADWP